MKKVVNVRFHDAGKVYKFSCDGMDLNIGDAVMVETSLGQDLAHVTEEPIELEDDKVPEDVVPILRLANEKEIERYSLKKQKEREAYDKCLVLIEKHGACGRLMCCLQFEKEAYADAHKRLPKVGRKIRTPNGVGQVSDVNLIEEKISVKFQTDEGTQVEVFDWVGLEPLNHDMNVKEIGCEGCNKDCPMAGGEENEE